MRTTCFPTRYAVLLLLGVFLSRTCQVASADERRPVLFEVRNGVWERFRAAVSITLSAEQIEAVKERRLVEMNEGGRPMAPVEFSVDTSNAAEPVLSWLQPGITAPGEVRRYAFVEKSSPVSATSDLQLTQTDTHIVIENSYFRIRHPKKGHGGFPDKIIFRLSGNEETRLSFYDRLHSKELRRGYKADADANATARVAFASSTRVVIETESGYWDSDYAPGNPRAKYRYVYSPCSPVVEVSCAITQDAQRFWDELHFLHPSRKDFQYNRFVVGDPPQEYTMATPGTKSRSYTGRHWGIMATDQDAVGVGQPGVTCWDASNEFVYYVRGPASKWASTAVSFTGLLYFGPSADDYSWFSRWLGAGRKQTVRVLADIPAGTGGATSITVPSGGYELNNDALRIAFADKVQGFACLGIENRLAGGARFVHPRDGAPGLWKIEFRGPMEGEGVKDEGVFLDNRSAADSAAKLEKSAAGQTLTISYRGLDLPGEPNVVDVTVEIRLAPSAGRSEWQISVGNRSKRLGLWETHFPVLPTVTPKSAADVVVPGGNWGARLQRNFRGSFDRSYPSAACPTQMMAFHRGDAGLYIAAHDGAARAKRLVLSSDQDASIVTAAENMGVPGSSVAAPFPVVIQAYRGDWWQAARIYRQWAAHQPWTRKGWLADRKDVPRHFTELGVWMLGGGMPKDVREWMIKTQETFPVSVGLHWYNWHEIPFDNSYPEYFPTKPDFDKVVRELVGRGQVMMPYTNGRLWDRDIPSFEVGIKGAAKQRSGEPYTEVYGSGRRLAPMCPATKLWQEKVNEIIHGLIHNCGVNAIYLDQIGAARPALCFDATHGHPVGGGTHWVDGYREMLNRVKAQGVENNVAFTTENTAEPYMDNIEGFLTWSERDENDIPLLPVIYSGYTIYYSSPQDPQDALDSFVAAQARDFLWGCQLGWNGTWMLEEQHRDKTQYLGKLCQYRLAAKDYLIYGELLDEIRPIDPVPTSTSTWYRRARHTATLPAVMGTLWRARDGSLGMAIANLSNEPRRFAYRIDPRQWTVPDTRTAGWALSRLTPQGSTPWRIAEGDSVQQDEILSPREVRLITLRPLTGMAELSKSAILIAREHPVESALGAAAREFIFQQAARGSSFKVELRESFLRVARGEPAELVVPIRNESATKREVRIQWPDGKETTRAVPAMGATEVSHVFWPSETDRDVADASMTVSLDLAQGKVARRFPVHLRLVAPVTVTMGFIPIIRGGESFILPVEVRNNSRAARKGTLDVRFPNGWGVEPGSQVELGSLPPDARRDILLKCTAPVSSATTQQNISLRFIKSAVEAQVTVLKSRASAECPFLPKAPKIDGKLDDWPAAVALTLVGDNRESVKISKGYGGEGDCSAQARVGWDATNFYIAAEVSDNQFHQDEDGYQIWRGDCIQLAFHPGAPNRQGDFDGTEHEVGLTKTAHGPLLFQWMPGACPLKDGSLAVVRDGNATIYEAAIPWTALGVRNVAPSSSITWSMTVNDNDGDGFRGWLQWTPGVCGGKNSSEFGWLRLGKQYQP